MKTAMQQLLQDIGEIKPKLLKKLEKHFELSYYTESEKKMVINAHINGQLIEDTIGFSRAEFYYNKTFKD